MGGVRKVITTNIGTAYTLTLNIDMGKAEGLYIMPRTTNGGNIYTGTNLAQVYVTSSGTYTVNFTATTSTTQLLVEKAGSVEKYFYIDNVKVEQSTPTLNSYPIADVVSAQHYYPFGSTMQTWEADGKEYAFGFNGKENDNETHGSGNTYDYGFRIYNSRLGKFLSVDPLTKSYPFYTPYQFAGNKPIAAVDLDGLEERIVIYNNLNDGRVKTTTIDYNTLRETVQISGSAAMSKPITRDQFMAIKESYFRGFADLKSNFISGHQQYTLGMSSSNTSGYIGPRCRANPFAWYKVKKTNTPVYAGVSPVCRKTNYTVKTI